MKDSLLAGKGLNVRTTVSSGQKPKFSRCVTVCTKLDELPPIKVFVRWRDARVDPAKPNLAVIAGAALREEVWSRRGLFLSPRREICHVHRPGGLSESTSRPERREGFSVRDRRSL